MPWPKEDIQVVPPKETRWIEVDGRERFCILSFNGTGHWWYDTFGDTLCALCMCYVWDDGANDPCPGSIDR